MRRSLGITEPGASRLEIARMRRRHLRGVMAIERQVYARPWSPNLFVAEMTEPSNRCYLVARIDKAVVGYAGMICYGDEAHITNIAVDPQRHRPRHRRAPAVRADAWRRSRWARTRSRWRSASRTGARSGSTRRFGFHPVGIRRNYYQELNEDALIMWTDDVRTDAVRRAGSTAIGAHAAGAAGAGPAS